MSRPHLILSDTLVPIYMVEHPLRCQDFPSDFFETRYPTIPSELYPHINSIALYSRYLDEYLYVPNDATSLLHFNNLKRYIKQAQNILKAHGYIAIPPPRFIPKEFVEENIEQIIAQFTMDDWIALISNLKIK